MSDLGNKKIFSENLNYYMSLYEKDRAKICNDLNFKYSTLRDWTNGRAYPRIDKIEMLANYFGIQKSDLIERKEKKIEYNRTSKLKEQILILSNSDVEKELLISCMNLDTPQQEAILNMIKLYLEKK